MLFILADFLIGMGGIIYFTIGEIIRTLFFLLGLITTVTFKFYLFINKVSLLTTEKTTSVELFAI